MKLAVFDIDGTLVRGTTERMFWWYLFRRGHQGPRQLSAFALFMLRYLPTVGIETPRKNKAYLSGIEAARLDMLARDFVSEKLMDRLYAPAVQRLEQHLVRRDLVVLVSGTLWPIARALADKLGVQRICATLLSQRNGIVLAQPPEIHPYDAAKLTLVRQLAADLNVPMDRVSAYANSIHDLFMLSGVGEAVAVLPDRRLLAAAMNHDWEIISDCCVEKALTS